MVVLLEVLAQFDPISHHLLDVFLAFMLSHVARLQALARHYIRNEMEKDAQEFVLGLQDFFLGCAMRDCTVIAP